MSSVKDLLNQSIFGFFLVFFSKPQQPNPRPNDLIPLLLALNDPSKRVIQTRVFQKWIYLQFRPGHGQLTVEIEMTQPDGIETRASDLEVMRSPGH